MFMFTIIQTQEPRENVCIRNTGVHFCCMYLLYAKANCGAVEKGNSRIFYKYAPVKGLLNIKKGS